ncbi:hypothetical protein D6D02_08790 [Aureobasidium pullulans]|nr:hypothetical protein D6D02_08790 [Aureobasidium pullulans]
MDKLPQEIIDHIFIFLPDRTSQGHKGHFASIALISRQWQQAVERRTFSRLALHQPEILEEFAQIFDETTSGPTRASALRRLSYCIQPPPQSYDDWQKCSSIDKEWGACSLSERNAELQHQTKVIMSRLKRLCDIIGGWSVRPSIDLAIHVPMRTEYCLVALEAVPKSQAIKRLRCSGGGVCSPALFISIASALPALQGIAFDISDLYYPLQRCKKRYDVELKFKCTTPIDELTNNPSTLLPNTDTDHLSLSL